MYLSVSFSYANISSSLKKRFVSAVAASSESEACTRFDGMFIERSALIVPASASRGFVDPISFRTSAIAWIPSNIIATTGVSIMYFFMSG